MSSLFPFLVDVSSTSCSEVSAEYIVPFYRVLHALTLTGTLCCVRLGKRCGSLHAVDRILGATERYPLHKKDLQSIVVLVRQQS